MTSRRVALLRGINVGGHRRVPMADLRASLGAVGFGNVRTYIQSGNVVFDLPVDGSIDDDPRSIATALGGAILERFGLDVPVVVRSVDDVARIATSHPDAGGATPDKWLHVFLLDREVEPSDAPDPERFAPDRWMIDGSEIYVTYPSGSGRSKLAIDVVERSFGAIATARNITTLAAVAALGRPS